MMNINEAIQELTHFHGILKNSHPYMSFEMELVPPWDKPDKPFKNWFREEVPGKNASKESGVYLIGDLDEKILYIGKAAANNLGAEIYSKFGAATNVDKNDIPTFSKSSLALWAPKDFNSDLIVKGDVLIRAVIVRPQEYASLAEVYLQIWCTKSGGLPILNKRIG